MKGKENFEIGIVVPVFQTKFIEGIIDKLHRGASRKEVAFLIVNDGSSQVREFFSNFEPPENFSVLHLSENQGFAAANNRGWEHLLERFPSLRFLGTINDDTIPRNDWLAPLVDALEEGPENALAAPVMETREGWFGLPRNYAAWELSNEGGVRMVRAAGRIRDNRYVPAVGGFCFLGRREALKTVGFFDERFRNSCEDLDLCLKLLSRGWRLVVCHESRVFHWGGASRYLGGARTDIDMSKRLLIEKWGEDFTRFNKINSQGFWEHSS